MDRTLSKAMTSPTDQKDLTTGNACWETPPEIYATLDREFHFDIDLCGGPGTQHRAPAWFGPSSPLGKDDALTTTWYHVPTEPQIHAGGILSLETKVGFCNPPYGPFIPKILDKAIAESKLGFTTVFLLPNRVTKWYKRAMREASEIRICDERIAFWEDGHPRWNAKIKAEENRLVPDPAMFDSCIVIIRPSLSQRQPLYPRAAFDLWHWDPERLQKCRLSIPL